jgi:hypothetical protein
MTLDMLLWNFGWLSTDYMALYVTEFPTEYGNVNISVQFISRETGEKKGKCQVNFLFSRGICIYIYIYIYIYIRERSILNK